MVRGAGASHVLDHRAGLPGRAAGHHRWRGVSVVVEMLADVNLEQDLGVLAVGGRVVVVGSRGRVELTPRLTMIKEATVMGTALWNASEAESASALAAVAAGSGAAPSGRSWARSCPCGRRPPPHRRILEPGAHEADPGP